MWLCLDVQCLKKKIVCYQKRGTKTMCRIYLVPRPKRYGAWRNFFLQCWHVSFYYEMPYRIGKNVPERFVLQQTKGWKIMIL